MARINLAKKNRNLVATRLRTRSSGKRAMGVQVTVESTRTSFRACARVSSKIGLASHNAPKGYYPCATGSNPRKAVAAALRKLAGQLGKRKGAFAGLGGE